MCQYVTIAVMPKRLTAHDLDAVKRDPLCEIEDKDELYKRIGWLICAYDAIVAARLKTPNAELCGSPKRSVGESERTPGYAAGGNGERK